MVVVLGLVGDDGAQVLAVLVGDEPVGLQVRVAAPIDLACERRFSDGQVLLHYCQEVPMASLTCAKTGTFVWSISGQYLDVVVVLDLVGGEDGSQVQGLGLCNRLVLQLHNLVWRRWMHDDRLSQQKLILVTI